MTKRLFIKTELKKAEHLRQFLLKNKLLDFSYEFIKDKRNIYFPLVSLSFEQKNYILSKFPVIKILKRDAKPKKKQPTSFKEALKYLLSKEELNHLITSFNIIGNIAIIEIPKGLEKKEKIIGKTLLKLHKNLNTVAKISAPHKGKYRIQPIKIIAGTNNTITLHKEHNCLFRLDIKKAFFSPRLSNERKRIANLIKNNEVVCVFFAGIGSYPIIFGKHSKAKIIYAIELNKNAFKYMEENIALNRLNNKVEPLFGDVKEAIKRFPKFFDRIVMPLPKDAEHFLNEAFCSIKDNGIIHFYQFVEKNNPFSKTIKLLKSTAKAFNKKITILRKAQVRSFSPSKIQIVIDFKVF